MSNNPLNITRNQLAEFLPNQRAIRVFEQLLKQVNDVIPSDVNSLTQLIQEAYVEASSGTAQAEQALDQLSRIAQSLELLATAPPPDPTSVGGDFASLPFELTKEDLVLPPLAAQSINELSDVRVTTPAAGNTLIYDATLRRFVNALLTAGTNISITNADGAITIAITGTVANATNATNATNVGTTDDTATNATHYLVLLSATTGNNPAKVSSSRFTVNPSTGLLTALKFGATGNGASPTASAMEIGTNGAGSRWLYNVPTGGEHDFSINGSNVFIAGSSGVGPGADDTETCGYSFWRWSTVYAATGTINTSDARDKTPVRSLEDAELKAAVALSKEIGAYKWLEAVKLKGDAARWHIGMTVQRAIEIMEQHGLNPFAYGFICYDEWNDEWDDIPEVVAQEAVLDDDGNVIEPAVEGQPAQRIQRRWAGNRYSFRPDGLLMFIAKGLEARLSAIESSLNL